MTTLSRLAPVVPLVLVGATLAIVQLGVQRHSAPDRASEVPAPPVAAPTLDFNTRVFHARAPYIPPQCYTKVTDTPEDETASNPCYVCHNQPERPNFIEDADLQETYSFGAPARQNPWTNLFVDRRPAIAKVSDETILEYVRASNLFDAEGENLLAARLSALEESWDANGDAKWNGYVPDAGFHFDEHGFDHDAHGRPTGWRAYAYYPFPGTFWPTNGSAGDALIRLPEIFRKSETGTFDQETYALNLAILEALVKKSNVPIPPTDERRHGVDLNRNGVLDEATHVAFHYKPREGKRMSYVGLAQKEFGDDPTRVAAGLFPQGTEFLHTVRYLDLVDGRVQMASRLKELRYAEKVSYRNYSQLEDLAAHETKEKYEAPDQVRQLLGDSERGLFNGQGWRYQAFIEDQRGDLRPQTVEETGFCMGCHGGISQTRDGVFSFSRKFAGDAFRNGWYHWSQKGLEGTPEPKRADGSYAYTHYLEHNHAGDELRSNEEVLEKFFTQSGKLRDEATAALHEDISLLLLPSKERALLLNKAYREVVLEQSFNKGRDAVLAPAKNVHQDLEEDQPTGVETPLTPDGVAYSDAI